MIRIKKEKMNRVFTKYHIKGLPFDIVLHHFKSVAGENAHDHPFSFQSIILYGGYTERIYTPTGESHDVFRAPGSTHTVAADCIHELIDLPKGECWTAILPQAKTREPGFWKFDEKGSWFRQWNKRWSRVK